MIRRLSAAAIAAVVSAACAVLAIGCASARPSIELPPQALQNPPDLQLPLRVDWIHPLYPNEESIPFHAVEYAEPAVVEGRIYVGASRSPLLCLAAGSGAKIWQFQPFGPIESRPLVVGDLVVFGDSDGMLYALDKHTGIALWTYQVGGEVMGEPSTDGENLYFTTAYNRLYSLKLADGSWRWMYQRDVPATFTVRGVSSPVVRDGVVYLGLSDGYVTAVDAKTGKEIWKNLLKIDERLADVDATPLIEGSNLYMAAYDGSLYRLGLEDGDVIWKSDSVGGISRPVSVGDYLITASSRGFVYAVSKSDGHTAWESDLRREDKAGSVAKAPKIRIKIPSRPELFGNVVLTVSNDGFLYALDPTNGVVQWRYDPGNGATAGFARDGDRLFFVGNAGHLFALRAAPHMLEGPGPGVLSSPR